jgi:drug/metabolite transporter (DMT)-like permease
MSAVETGARPAARLAGIVLVNVATLTWATNMVLGRWLRDYAGPLTLAAARYTIACLLFALLLRRQPPTERQLGQDRRLLFAMGIVGVVLFAPTLYLGLRFTTAVNATLINGFGPLITGLLAALLIQESMSRRQVTGALVGLAGVLVLISGGSLAFWSELGSSVGDLIMVGAVTLWGLYSVLSRRAMYGRSALSATAFSAFLGLPLLVLGAVWELQAFPVTPSPELALAVLYIGLFPTGIGFLAWNAGVRRLGASGAMVFYNTLPLYGTLLGILLLGETVGLSHLVGGALIVGGGLWAARGSAEAAPWPFARTRQRPNRRRR